MNATRMFVAMLFAVTACAVSAFGHCGWDDSPIDCRIYLEPQEYLRQKAEEAGKAKADFIEAIAEARTSKEAGVSAASLIKALCGRRRTTMKSSSLPVSWHGVTFLGMAFVMADAVADKRFRVTPSSDMSLTALLSRERETHQRKEKHER